MKEIWLNPILKRMSGALTPRCPLFRDITNLFPTPPSLQECLMDPGCYRVVEEAVRQETKGRGTLELLSIKEVADEEHIF